MMNSIEDRLKAKIKEAKYKKSRRSKAVKKNIFDRIAVISPNALRTTNYFNRTPIAAFNPGVSSVYERGKLDIYPRLNYDCVYNQSPSAIGKFQIDLDRLFHTGDNPAFCSTEVVIYPQNPWEIHGCEDPRVYQKNGNPHILYAGWGTCDGEKKSVLALSSGKEKDYFRISSRKDMVECIPFSNKDAAILNYSVDHRLDLLLRLDLGDKKLFCWSGEGWADTYEIIEDTLEVQIIPNEYETRVGWSTNAISLNKHEYLVGWHATMKQNLEYRNGLAVVDALGNLKAISDYLLTPQGIEEWVGNRYGVIFGCGLVKYNDQLVWVGGISDWAIGIFTVGMDTALSELRWI